MLRPLDIVLILVMAATAAVTYTIKYSAEATLDEVRRLDDQIALEKNTIDLLEADQALLTQPARLSRLAEYYADELQLQPAEPEQIATLDQLPPIAPEPPAEEDLPPLMAGTAPDGTDVVITGSVTP
ncbi:cell division protein FtsL [Martelella mediterranea]|uniref:Cell division protein FtsL n=1 Tax=Martelella mediterranea TaxID=293089 RepID=A0A4R3NW33_9HYPH|nr:hypothetical protein [Martelella mediterranea]TCT43145.1 hypothetical protein EDC90_1003156 [Martelella mediterranea]